MRCPRCGNENPATNRFCGMCGATLLPATPPAEVAPRVAAPIPVPPPVVPEPAARVHEPPQEEPVISGPSFLGLNQPASRSTSGDQRGPLSIDPRAAPASRDLDYLLEDDAPKHGGGWKAVAIFLALALAVGLGYLRWRNQGLGWLNSEGRPAAQSADDSTAAPATAAPSAATGGAAAPTTNPPASADASTPAANPTTATSGAPDAGSAPALAATSQPPAAQNSANQSAASQAASPSDAKPLAAAAAAKAPAGKDGGAESADDSSAPAERVKPSAASEPAAKPRETARPVAVDPVVEAQKYLYGKGVPQNCDRGLRLLKPAADHANPKAMVEMGALYSAGLCTPRDLPTAYRWFAMALRKEPDNDSVQADLQKLWGEMTQPERQLAIKLSQ